MKPTPEQLNGATEELRAIPYFPTADAATIAIAIAIGKFVDDVYRLRWLIDTAVSSMREWKGVAEMRGLYCTRFKPADGVEANCTVAGFTPADSEMGYLQAASEPKRIEESRKPAVVQAITGKIQDIAKGKVIS